MTATQLSRFIHLRNKSPFQSNLQFEIDAQRAGFDSKELGTAIKTDTGYEWRLKDGWFLVEKNGKLYKDYRGETFVLPEFTLSAKRKRKTA